jgi:hypothetical protein
MKNIIEIELFGDNVNQMIKLYRGISEDILPGFWDATIGTIPQSGWVAEITGFDSIYKYARKFLKCKKDYSRSNKKGSRGVFIEYILESGHIYEVKKKPSWNRTERYFCIVSDEGDIIKISEDEVVAKLKALGCQPQCSENKSIRTDSKTTYYAAINMLVDGDLTEEQKHIIEKRIKTSLPKINKYLTMLCERMDGPDLLNSLETGKFAYSSVNNIHYHIWKLLTEEICEFNYNADIVKLDRISTNSFVKEVELWLKKH